MPVIPATFSMSSSWSLGPLIASFQALCFSTPASTAAASTFASHSIVSSSSSIHSYSSLRRSRVLLPTLSVIQKRQQPTKLQAIAPAITASRTTHTSTAYSRRSNSSSSSSSTYSQYYGTAATEHSTLSGYPRPNLFPTLHFRLGGSGSVSPPDEDGKQSDDIKCRHCAGPHRAEFCPC